MVMGDDSCSRGSNPGTVYWMDIFSHCIVCLKRLKINEKQIGIGPFKKAF